MPIRSLSVRVLWGAVCSFIWLSPCFAQPAVEANKAPRAESKPPDITPILVIAPQARLPRDRALAALPKAAACNFFEKRLSDVVQQLSKEAGIPIELDQKALDEATIGTDTQITLRRDKTTLREVLDGVGQPHGLTWVVRSPGIVVTTRDEYESNPAYRDKVVYPVTDLLKDSGHPFREDAYQELIDLVTTTVDPDSWKDQGTGEGTIAISAATGSLVVNQSRHVHEEIENLLAALRMAKTRQLPDSRPLIDPNPKRSTANPGGNF